MTNPVELDGARLMSWARRVSAELEANREYINSLNVFPVPDSDTGSNMAFTIASAVAEAEQLADSADASEVAAALARGSIKGARGNSGIVLSQVLRGVAQAASEGAIDAGSISAALAHAVAYVERAIAAPVEGTIVTVLRAAARAAEKSAGTGGDIVAVSRAALDAAQAALEETPSQLAELREAGVVDAGGAGLVLMLSVLYGELTEHSETTQTSQPSSTDDPHEFTHGGGAHTHGDAAAPGWLEVMFMFSGAVDELEESLSPMGRSFVVARVTDTEAKVHIHTTAAGAVIERAYVMGQVSDLRLEILPDATPLHESRRAGRLIIAVTPPGSVTDLYSQAGAITVAPGPGFIANVKREISSSDAREIIVLPNGQLDPETLAAVEQAAESASLSIVVLPSVRLVNGIAALAVHDPALPLDAAAQLMREAVEDMQVADIMQTESGFCAVARDRDLARGSDLPSVVEAACRELLGDEGELITMLLATHCAGAVDAVALGKELGAEVLVYPADGLSALGHIGVE